MIDPSPAPMGAAAASDAFRRLVDNVELVIAGNTQAVETAAVCLFADGNLLLEGVPGVGKTTLARALARSIGGEFSRVQATPDLLPSDLTGISVYDQQHGEFRFVPGPVFANVVLVDEINRTTPRTQSALLEPMEERQVTVEGTTYPLPVPYVVIATENPIEQHGTYPLPEGQLDRFAMTVQVGYPDDDRAGDIVRRQLLEHPMHELRAVLTPDDVLAAQRAVRSVHVDDAIIDYVRGDRGGDPRGARGRAGRVAQVDRLAHPVRPGARRRARTRPRAARRREGAGLGRCSRTAWSPVRRGPAPRSGDGSSAACSTRSPCPCTRASRAAGGSEAMRLRKRAFGLLFGAGLLFFLAHERAGRVAVRARRAAVRRRHRRRRCCRATRHARGHGRAARAGRGAPGRARRSST